MRIEDLIERTTARIRKLRSLRWGSWGLLLGLGVSTVYLALTTLGWVEDAVGSWLFWANLGAAFGAALAGYFAPVNTTRMLFEIDQSLKTGEVLLTLHDLKQRSGKNDFISILEHHLVRLKIRPELVFHVNSGDWKRGGSVLAALGIVLTLLWFGPHLLELAGLNVAAVTGESKFSFENGFNGAALPEDLLARLSEFEQFVPRLGAEFARDADGGSGNSENLIQLFNDLQKAQDQTLGLSSSNGPAIENDPQSEAQRQQRRDQLQELQQQLQRLLAQLAQDPADDDALANSAAAVQQSLQSLREDDPLREQIENALNEQDAASRQTALEGAQQQLDERLNRDRQLESLREALKEWSADESNFASEDLPELGQLPEDVQLDRENSSAGTGVQDNPNDSPPGSNGDAAEDEASQQGDERAFRDGAGDEPSVAPSPRQNITDNAAWEPEYKNAQIPPGLAPADSVEEWLSRGVPLETNITLGAATQYRLSYDRVETLLDLRDLSPEVQDVVRLYFLKIIGQLNETNQTQAAPAQEAK